MYAGFWRRFAAFIIDMIILQAVFFIIASLMGTQLYSGAISFQLWLLFFIVFFLYFAIFEASPMQATPGKMAIGIKVTDLHCRRVSFGRALGRNLGKIISQFIFYIGYLMAGITRQKQALHDKMADCLVVTKDAKPGTLHPLHPASVLLRAFVLLVGLSIMAIFAAGVFLALTIPSAIKATQKAKAEQVSNTVSNAFARQQAQLDDINYQE